MAHRRSFCLQGETWVSFRLITGIVRIACLTAHLSDSPMLSLDEISKYFGDRAILDRASWSMADDGRVALVGLNGAGKSTLLKMIAGVITPDSGRITRPQRTAVGYLPQDAPEMGGRPLITETLSALSQMNELDRRRRELERLVEKDHSGPGDESA